MGRRFSRGTPGTTAASQPRGARAREGTVFQALAGEYFRGLGVHRTEVEPTGDAIALLSVAVGRKVTKQEALLYDEAVWKAAHEVCGWCMADEHPRWCGAYDDRFSFWFTRDQPQPCPLEGCCVTRERDIAERGPGRFSVRES